MITMDVLSMTNLMLLFPMVYSDLAKNHYFDHFCITAILVCLVHMCARNNKEICTVSFEGKASNVWKAMASLVHPTMIKSPKFMDLVLN